MRRWRQCLLARRGPSAALLLLLMTLPSDVATISQICHPLGTNNNCGPKYSSSSCPELKPFCWETNGWCGNTWYHKAFSTTTYDYCIPSGPSEGPGEGPDEGPDEGPGEGPSDVATTSQNCEQNCDSLGKIVAEVLITAAVLVPSTFRSTTKTMGGAAIRRPTRMLNRQRRTTTASYPIY